MNAFYRLRQFWQGFFARVAPEEVQAIQPLLPPAAFVLFCRLPRDAQRHSLNVLHDLQQHGPLHPDLAVAALLHDVGKLAADEAGVSINLWLRGPLVLLKALSPALFQRLQSPSPVSGWRYALYVSEAHPQIGAAWAREAGCSALACWLIEQHQSDSLSNLSEHTVLLQALQQADARN